MRLFGGGGAVDLWLLQLASNGEVSGASGKGERSERDWQSKHNGRSLGTTSHTHSIMRLREDVAGKRLAWTERGKGAQGGPADGGKDDFFESGPEVADLSGDESAHCFYCGLCLDAGRYSGDGRGRISVGADLPGRGWRAVCHVAEPEVGGACLYDRGMECAWWEADNLGIKGGNSTAESKVGATDSNCRYGEAGN